MKHKIAVVEAQVQQALGDAGSQDWRIWFAEVFSARDGFDIVIANPPYVRFQKIRRAYKQMLKAAVQPCDRREV